MVMVMVIPTTTIEVPPLILKSCLRTLLVNKLLFNKSVEEKFGKIDVLALLQNSLPVTGSKGPLVTGKVHVTGKIDVLASKVDSLALDVELLKLKVMPHDVKESKTLNAIQVRIDDNVRMLAELHARWEREDEIARKNNMTEVCTITTTSDAEVSNASKPPTINGKIIVVGKVPTHYAKLPKTTKTISNKNAEIFRSMGDNGTTTFDNNDFDLDGCNISKVIMFLQNLARSPNASAINMAFTKHITNALMQIREEKLKQEVSIPKKLEDGWEPIIKMKVNDFDYNALCDLGASISVMTRKIYDMLDLPPLENCYLGIHLVDIAKKKPLGRINDVLIMVNKKLVPIDFFVFDIECNALMTHKYRGSQ
jgi:hypothetical protein